MFPGTLYQLFCCLRIYHSRSSSISGGCWLILFGIIAPVSQQIQLWASSLAFAITGNVSHCLRHALSAISRNI